ncbi:histidinol-phosphate transaminase [Cysteiniphilum sp. QT6929]|uniref:histidinol-phosphate transaminase n=1 Tax=Cysteiniphilum sp. QT6929 TaxID=2975055 RepID=UPI0024B35E4F|nr:histidinol-phosphate transaminase [Cysteiniphilum sp. QT6929]WHN66218.1 histidinol-phosphate transaminase [Cysteiniphilum sp. QT6929]
MFEKLIRQDLAEFSAYSSARSLNLKGDIWLNANELPYDLSEEGFNRYPEPQPQELVNALATLYQVDQDEILVTRGSDEGIDLLVRLFCTYQQDAIMAFKPTFGMYQVSARLQGVEYVEYALDPTNEFALDIDDLLKEINKKPNIKLVFICSPNNPTGNLISREDIESLCLALADKSMIVVDEAYIEFSGEQSAASLIKQYDNLVILRTLSKAYGLAAERVGSVITNARLVSLIKKVIAPYPIALSVAQNAVAALQPARLALVKNKIHEAISQRTLLFQYLQASRLVNKVYPSQANFLLVQFKVDIFNQLCQAGIIVRSMAKVFNDETMLRISIGTVEEVNKLIKALENINTGTIGANNETA